MNITQTALSRHSSTELLAMADKGELLAEFLPEEAQPLSSDTVFASEAWTSLKRYFSEQYQAALQEVESLTDPEATKNAIFKLRTVNPERIQAAIEIEFTQQYALWLEKYKANVLKAAAELTSKEEARSAKAYNAMLKRYKKVSDLFTR